MNKYREEYNTEFAILQHMEEEAIELASVYGRDFVSKALALQRIRTTTLMQLWIDYDS